MFNAAQNTAAPASLRSSRRRQRPLSNEGSISQPKAKRLRSTLNEKTFQPPDTEASPEMEEAKRSRIATLPRRVSAETPSLHKEVVVRGRKPRATDQNSKGDGSVVLTTNDTYTVSKLPALPDRLRADVTGRQHGAIDAESGYALAFTHTHAIVWPYTANMTSPETFTFALPHPSKHISDPLPLGALVSASASSSEPGLVIVIPTTGRITYWESIASAATLDLRLQRGGVEFVIPGVHAGDTVILLENAESAGFILGFSSGKIAYMSVRDGQGRPTISVQFLERAGGTSSGGIFGSLRNVLSSSTWKGQIAAIHAQRSEQVGQRNVTVATVKGKIQAWEVHRGGHTSLISESDGRESIVMAIKQALPSLSDANIESFELLDFAYAPKSIASSQLATSTQVSDIANDGVHLLLLTSLRGRDTSHYSLVEAILRPDSLILGTVRPIQCYTTPVVKNATSKTRLYLPSPALVSYIVFDRAVVIISMAKQPESPDNQLRLESHLGPQSFEDVVDLRDELNVEIVGSGFEEPIKSTNSVDEVKSRRYKPRHPATVLLIRGGGVVRVAATDIPKLHSTKPQKVTAKSKLEQAVFFGTIDSNPLKFSVRQELQFSPDEVGVAALELSMDILSSQTPYIPSVPASIDQNLRKRSKALADLAKYIKASRVELSRATKWKLLAHAEKMAAAATMWKQYETSLKAKHSGEKRTLFSELVECIHEDWKTEPVAGAGEVDRVRHWFIHDIWNLEIALPWTFQILKMSYQENQTELPVVLEMMSEGNDILLGALTSAFEFRSANLATYGLQDEEIEHGILKAGYEGLPEPWTSFEHLARNSQRQSGLGGFILREQWNNPEQANGISRALLENIRQGQPGMIENFIRVNNERIRWEAAQDSPQSQVSAEEKREEQAANEREQLIHLAESDLVDEAIHIAEKYEILNTLASIILNMVINAEPTKEQLSDVQIQIKGFFTKFGSRWASAFFEQQINGDSQGSLGYLFEGFSDREVQDYLSEFLRTHPEYAKISWIQEVLRNRNFELSSTTLLAVGLYREQNLWKKQVELSIGKMARMSSGNYKEPTGLDSQDADIVSANNQLALAKIQEEVYEHVLLTIHAAIDENAELQLALETHGNKELRNRPRLASLLEDALSKLLKREAVDALTLIDLLTLMTPAEEDYGFQGRRFYLALQASCRGLSSVNEKRLIQRIVWRRCMLQDDWIDVNDTDLKDDFQVSERLRNTALYGCFESCLKNRLFDDNSGVQAITPEAVLGAGIGELDSRSRSLDASIRENLMKDMQAEDDALNPSLQQGRLEKWFQGALELAKQDYAEGVEAETTQGHNLSGAAEELLRLEQAIHEKEQARGNSLLRTRPRYKARAKLNGNGSASFKASIKQY